VTSSLARIPRIAIAGRVKVKIVDFKPQQDTVAIGLVIRIADRPVVVFDLKAVKLEDQHTVRDQSFIFRPTVRAPTADETLVSPATRFDVGHRDEGLGPHQNLRRNSARAIFRRRTLRLSCRGRVEKR
jgi:hypothetical protein